MSDAMQLSQRIQAVQPSATLAVTAKAKAMRADGIDVLALSAGEPDFDTPDNIKQAAHAAIDAGQSKYTPVPGTPALRKAVAEATSKAYGSEFSVDQVIVGAGGKQVLFNAFAALLDPGDEVIIPSPYWVSYPDMARFADATPVTVASADQDRILPNADEMGAVVTDKTRLLVINSPSNPSGAAYDRASLEAIAAMLRKHPRIFVITDDIYRALVYDGEFVSIAQVAPDLLPRILIADGVSKTYAMTGWRVGYGIGPAALISAMGRLQGASTSGASSIAQAAALEAVAGDQSAVSEMRAIFKSRRDRMVAALRAIPEVTVALPEGAFYVFPNIGAYLKGDIESSQALCTFLLEKVHLAAVPGGAFGADNHVRLSFACGNEQIDEGVARLAKGLAMLR